MVNYIHRFIASCMGITKFLLSLISFLKKCHTLITNCAYIVIVVWFIMIYFQCRTKITDRITVNDKKTELLLNVANLQIDYDYISAQVLSLRNHSLKSNNTQLLLSEQQSEIQCPKLPPTLGGHLNIDRTLLSLRQLISKYRYLQHDGRFCPSSCKALQRLAVILPYRKRWSHLMVLFNNLIPFLTRQQADVTFFVIHQKNGSTFNRGALLNVGFLEANKVGHFDCFIFHDVDLIPLNDKNLYRCGDKPRHLAVAINKFSYSIPYLGYFGGVVGLTTQQYMEINGNSNLYIGWGGEDDDLLARIFNKGYYISRYSSDISKYDMIKHAIDEGNEPNPYRENFVKYARHRQAVDGLNTVSYNKTATRNFTLFTLVTVDILNEKLLHAAPQYIQDIMKNVTINSTESTFNKTELTKFTNRLKP